jgi:hypothetical protein
MGAGLLAVKSGFILFIKSYQCPLQINTLERERERVRERETRGDLVGDKRGRLCLQNLVSIITRLGRWVRNLVDKLCRQLLVSNHASNAFEPRPDTENLCGHETGAFREQSS